MKNKKNLLSVLLAAVLLCACVAGMLIVGASAGSEELDPNTILYLVRSADGNDDGSVDEDGVLVFKTIRGAITYADEQTWGSNEKLRIEIDQDSIASTRSDSYLFTTASVGVVEREDYTPLPITLTGRNGAKTEVTTTTTSSSTGIYLCNNWYIDNVDISISGDAAAIYISCDVEFHDVEFSSVKKLTIRSNGYLYTNYFLTAANIAERLDENDEITVTTTYSGNTVVKCETENAEVYGTNAYGGEKTTSPGSNWPETLTLGDKSVKRYQFNGKVVVKDNAEIKGTALRARNSTYLGDGVIEIYDNAKTTQIQNIFNRSVINGSVNRVEIFGGTVASIRIFSQAKSVENGSTLEVKIHGGVTGAVNAYNSASGEGSYTISIDGGTVEGAITAKNIPATLAGGTFKGNVTGDSVTLADNANIALEGAGKINATEVGANVTVNKLDDWADFATVYVKAPQNAAITVVDNSESDACILNDENGYEVRGWYLAPSVSMILNQRVQLKALINKELCQLYTANFGTPAFSFKLGDKDLGVSAADLAEEGENYAALLPAAGAGDFDLALDYIFGGKVAISTNIQTVAANGAALYAGAPEEAIFKALVDYGAAANGAAELQYFDATKLDSALLPDASAPVKGEGAVKIDSVTLLMGDAIGIRFKTQSDLTGIAVKVNGSTIAPELYSAKDGAIDLYVNAANLNEVLTIEIFDAQGTVSATFGYAVSNIASEIYAADNTNLRAAAVLELILAIETAKTAE